MTDIPIPPLMKTCDMPSLLMLADLHKGISRMTRRQFQASLKRSIGATSDYADGYWVGFQDNPLGYLVTRNPLIQSVDLLKVAAKNAAKP